MRLSRRIIASASEAIQRRISISFDLKTRKSRAGGVNHFLGLAPERRMQA
jgi:hypothetical protein